MKPLEAYNKTKILFTRLENCHDVSTLKSLAEELNLLEQINKFYEKYPAFDLSLSSSDIAQLHEFNVLTEHNTLNPVNFPPDPLSKLLAAVLWKNGDINKVQHIVDGVVGSPTDRSEYSLIFKQFGASLSSNFEPIVDQHVLRAFEINCLEAYSEVLIEKSRNKSIFKKGNRPLLDKYRKWFSELLSTVSPSERAQFRELLDKIIFLHGKGIKI